MRVTTLYEGTSQIQKLIIGRAETGLNALVPVVVMIVGVLGAGTMGAGIAQLAAAAGARTLVHDPDAEALERGLAGIAERLEREVEKGRLEAGAAGPVEAAAEVAALADADIVIEAAPESLELKRSLFESVAEVVREDCVLATNTSSLSVTEIAAGVPGPERVVGMHFFNPAPVMKLVEVVAGEQSGEAALEATRELGRAMGRHVIDAGDGPGFLVNRCKRPFGLEALRARAGGAGDPRAGRPHLPPRRRLPDGPVRADGPRGDRRRLRGLEVVLRPVLRRAALAAVDARGAQGGVGQPRPQDRPRLVRVRRRRAPPARGPAARRSRAAATAGSW